MMLADAGKEWKEASKCKSNEGGRNATPQNCIIKLKSTQFFEFKKHNGKSITYKTCTSESDEIRLLVPIIIEIKAVYSTFGESCLLLMRMTCLSDSRLKAIFDFYTLSFS